MIDRKVKFKGKEYTIKVELDDNGAYVYVSSDGKTYRAYVAKRMQTLESYKEGCKLAILMFEEHFKKEFAFPEWDGNLD